MLQRLCKWSISLLFVVSLCGCASAPDRRPDQPEVYISPTLTFTEDRLVVCWYRHELKAMACFSVDEFREWQHKKMQEQLRQQDAELPRTHPMILRTHEVPDGKTPREQCENRCEKKHCDCVRDGEQNCGDKRDRCKRSCTVTSIRA